MVAAFTARVPKLVEIANPRLACLYILMQAVCVALLSCWFASSRFWEKEESLGQLVRGSLWVDHDSGSPDFVERLEALDASLCSQLAGYSYWFDKAGLWRYSNFSCVVPCKPGQTEGCISMHEAHSNAGLDEAFLVTHQQTTQLGRDGQVQGVEDSFVLTAEAMDVTVSYFFDLPLHSWDGSLPSQSPLRGTGATSKEVATRLVDSTGAVRKTFAPGEEIKMSVPFMLELSGDHSGLDALNAAAGTNKAPGSQARPAPTRLSGLELELHVDCYPNSRGDCYLSVIRSQRAWVYERRFERSANGAHRVSVSHGVRLVLVGGGVHRHFHMTTLVSKLTACVVLLSLPNRLLSLVCIMLLGHLSVIYRQAIVETFNLEDNMAGMSARLMVWSASFVDLVDKHLPGGESVVSKRRLHEGLKSVLRPSDRLGSQNTRPLVDYCFRAISNLSRTPDMGFSGEGAELNAYLDSSNFSSACTSNEHVNFSSAVALLDKDRKRSFFERLFTPKHLAQYTWTQAAGVGDPMGRMDSLSSDESLEQGEAPQYPSERCPSNHSSSNLSVQAGPIASTHVLSRAGSVPISISSAMDTCGAGDLTLESEKQLTRHLPRRVARLVKDHQSLREHCNEQLNFLDRVYRHLEHRFQELTQSVDQWQRAAEQDRSAVEEQQKTHQREREAASQELRTLEQVLQQHSSSSLQEKGELQRGVDTLRQSVHERLAACEARIAAFDERTTACEDKLQQSVKRRGVCRPSARTSDVGLPQAAVHQSETSATTPPAQAASPRHREATPPADSPDQPQWQVLFRNTLSRPPQGE